MDILKENNNNKDIALECAELFLAYLDYEDIKSGNYAQEDPKIERIRGGYKISVDSMMSTMHIKFNDDGSVLFSELDVEEIAEYVPKYVLDMAYEVTEYTGGSINYLVKTNSYNEFCDFWKKGEFSWGGDLGRNIDMFRYEESERIGLDIFESLKFKLVKDLN